MMNNRVMVRETRCRDTIFRWGSRTYVMGIVNVSADSFSGDGVASAEHAVAQAKRFSDDGADIIDIGGESSRPGAEPVSVDEELRRVIPVVQRICAEVSLPVSVDTYKYEVARAALDAGAHMLNDIWALRDVRLAGLAAERHVPIILMSNQRSKQKRRIIPAILTDLKRAIGQALEYGVPGENIIIDPGVGFGKTFEQNCEIVRRLFEIRKLNQPVLLGTSRKSMLGLVLDLPPDQRVEGTAATVAIGIAHGADIVRVHDVREMVRVCRMSDAITRQSRKVM